MTTAFVHRMNRAIILLPFVALLILVKPAGGVGLYRVTEMPALGDISISFAHDINERGQVAVSATVSDQLRSAFMWHPMEKNGTAGSLIHLDPESSRPGWTYGINLFGQATGSLSDKAFLWQPNKYNDTTGTLVSLPNLPDSRSSVAYAINDLGQIVGSSEGIGVYSPVLWHPTAPNGTSLEPVELGNLPSAESGSAYAINNAGQIVGTSGNRAFLWQPASDSATGTLIDISEHPGPYELNTAADINDVGQVIGFTTGGVESLPLLWTPSTPNSATGTLSALSLLPDDWHFTYALGINNLGQIVGGAEQPTFEPRFSVTYAALIWDSNGRAVDLSNHLEPISGAGWKLRWARDINDVGQIVGWGEHNGRLRGFLLTPIPEPTGILLFNIAIFLLLLLPTRALSQAAQIKIVAGCSR